MTEAHDYIIVGGGPGGSVVSNRLSKNPKTSVCLLEAGGPGKGLIVKVPLLLILNATGKTKHNWAFDTVPQKGLNGRVGYQPRGKGLGGSTAINALVYMRGHRKDYDEWANNGCPGWGYEDVLPYFKKSEHNEVSNDEFHGQNGEMNVAALRTDNPYLDIFKDACLESQIKENHDFNGAHQEGFGLSQVMQKNGERYSAADAFIHPIADTRDNLTIHLNTKVMRVIFKDKKAIGVEVSQNGQHRYIYANKEVILAAGALQTPQILQLSGVGNAVDLSRHGIDIVHDLSNVGENCHDHPDFIMAYHLPDPEGLLGVSPKGLWYLFKNMLRYRKERRGMFATNFAEINGFLRLKHDSPRPEVQYHFVIAPVVNHGRTFVRQHGFSCHILCLRPKSRGSVKLRSSNFEDAPLIDPAILSHPDDMACIIAGAKKMRDVITSSTTLSSLITKDMFTENCQTDREWEAVIRKHADTNYHPVGTCRMGIDNDAVVDARTLKVNGLEGLRISDASVFPTIPGGNTTAPTLMVGERCADFILSEQQTSIA